MNRLCFVALLCLIGTFTSAQDCRTQDSLTLATLKNSFQFKPDFEWNLELPMEEWHGVSLSPEGCVQQLNLSGALNSMYAFNLNTVALPQLTHLDLSHNNLNEIPHMTTATQLLYVNVAHNNLDFRYFSRLPNSADLVYAPQAILDCPTDAAVYLGTNHTIQLDCYTGKFGDVLVWYKDGIAIYTTASPELELANIQSSDAGAYTVTITNSNFPDLTLETMPSVLSIADCRERDSLVLAEFYHRYARFKSEFDWELDSPMENWYGVTLSPEGCVERLDLSGTLYAQYSWANLNDLSMLTYLDLSNNELDRIPDLRQANQLTYLNIANNHLNFSDLWALPGSTAGEVIYAPQGIIDCPMDLEAYAGTDYNIWSYCYSTNNGVFVWYKDGTVIDTTAGGLTLTDVEPSDAGSYSVIITDLEFPDLTLETSPITLNVKSCRKRDSLVLVEFYKDVEFKTAAQQWDLSQSMDTWYGVTLSAEGCLERLDIPNTLKGGYFNDYKMEDWTELTYVDVSNNQLTTVYGGHIIPNLTYFNIQNNQLNLANLVPFASAQIDSFIYTPQLPVPMYVSSVVDMAGSDVSIATYPRVDNGDNPGHVFKWYRNGVEVATIMDETLDLDSLQIEDSGIYTCEMTNPALPDLILYSDSVRVLVASDAQLLDSLILVDFYDHVAFKPGHSWDLSQPMDTWEGVTLNAERRVQELVLPNVLTEGELKFAMQRLSDLEVIDLSNNNLTGTFISYGYGVAYSAYAEKILPKLSYVDLSNNQLLGIINIVRLVNPQNLKYLDFSNNEIGDFDNLSIATGLEYLDLSDNPITYQVSALLPQSADLEVFKAANSFLAGSSYNTQVEREQFHTIELQNNRMTHLMPDFFGPSVDSLNVAHNRLTFEDLLQPNIPETYIYAPQDTVGTAYAIHQAPSSSHTIYLDFDVEVENNTYAWYKNGSLITTTTEGSLSLTNLQNTDTGEYTCQVTNAQLPDLTLHTAPVTLIIDEIYSNNCRLRDSLALVEIGAPENNSGYQRWDFSEPLENWGGIELSEEGCVTRLNFSDDGTSRISPAIGQLLDIEYIRIDETPVSGTIPRTIGNLTNLRHFAITDDNNIEEPIPVELTTLPNLEVLKLGNYFDEIPPEIGNLTTLKELLIGVSSTELLNEIGNLTNLESLSVFGNLTTLPDEIGNLINLEYLLIRGDLTTLPATMSNMTNLNDVYLAENQLNALPSNLAENWTHLESIDLDENYLTFDDIIQFKDFNFGYQNIIGTPDTAELAVGDNFMIDLEFDENVTDNTYHWFRNSIPIGTTTQNQLILNDVQLEDVGIYTCKVYNTTLTNYVLNTAPITLIIGNNAPESPVYPGDANADGIVNCVDPLFWGLAEGNAGPERPDASAIWTPQPISDWSNSIDDINGKHQDADGSGLVDEADLDIIEVNYLKTNADYQQQFYQNNTMQITPKITQLQSFNSSSEYELDINLGSSTQGAATIHGVSFSVDMGSTPHVESYTAELINTDSWLEPSNITSMNDEYTKRSGFALTRSNLQDKTGIGSVGTAIVVIQNLPTADTPQFRAVIRNITAIQSDGTLLRGEDVFIGGFSSGSAEGFIPGLAFETMAYAATCQDPSSATVTMLSGTAPYQYQWSNGDANATAENLTPGEYEVTVTDNFGQTLTGSVIVPDGAPLPDIQLQTNTAGQIEMLSNRTDIQYEWNGTQGTASENLTPGEHILTISDSLTCSKTVSVWVSDIYANVILEGAYDTTFGLMNDNLRQLNLIPLTDPYTGRMMTTDAVLQTTGDAAIVDWVLLELHDKDTPGKVISSYPALLQRDGFIVSNDGITPPRIAVPEETDYYLVIKHRNHLPVKSGEVVSLAQVAVSQSFEEGNASMQKQMADGTHATFAGDIITDHTVDGADKVIWEPMNGTFNQYHPADTNLDGDISGADKGVWFDNNGTFTDIE